MLRVERFGANRPSSSSTTPVSASGSIDPDWLNKELSTVKAVSQNAIQWISPAPQGNSRIHCILPNRTHYILFTKEGDPVLDQTKTKEMERNVFMAFDSKGTPYTFTRARGINARETWGENDITALFHACSRIARIYLLARQGENYCAIQEYFNAGDLFSLDSISEEHVSTLAKNIIEGVNQLHEKGFAHLDLDSEAVFVKKDSAGHITAKIGALSVCAKEIAESFESINPYMSPELASWLHSKKNPKPPPLPCDLWSLGCLLFLLLTDSDPPWTNRSGLTQDQFLIQIENAGRENEASPQWKVKLEEKRNEFGGLVDLTLRLLSTNPANRPSAAEALLFLKNEEIRREFEDSPTKKAKL